MANNFSHSPSKYFKTYEWTARQDLVDSLVIGSIKQNGLNMKYLPKENFVRDELFGDDTFTQWEKAITLDCYIKNVESFGGSGDIFTRFGFQINDTITVVISKTRWFQVQENDFFPNGTDDIRQNPQAGDLVYFPLFGKIFEITHVEQEAVFWQFGKNYIFELNCELYKYNEDTFNTGFDGIDEISELFSTDPVESELKEEDGTTTLTTEDGEPIIMEDYEIKDKNVAADNDLIQKQAEEVVDMSKKSPFTRGKW